MGMLKNGYAKGLYLRVLHYLDSLLGDPGKKHAVIKMLYNRLVRAKANIPSNDSGCSMVQRDASTSKLQSVDMTSEEGYTVIFENCYPGILRFVNARVKSIEDAEDITNDVFRIGWEKRCSYRGTGPPIAWLGKIAYNLTKDYWRKEKRKEKSYEDLKSQGNEEIYAHKADVLPTKAERAGEVANRLPQGYKDIIQATYYLGLSSVEIAEMLELSPENVRIRRYRALKMLRKMMT